MFDSGKAAFNRVWLGRTIARGQRSHQIYWRPTRPVVTTGFAAIPGGPGGSGATLGGYGLAVSGRTIHRQEAVKYVGFLTRAQIESFEKGTSFVNQPGGSSASDIKDQFDESIRQGSPVVHRPSVETGALYKQVSAAYFGAVHSVLTGKKDAREAAVELEKQLIQITGFRTGAPKTGN
jgi:trehalose/maltose transport system substrate-binding protein